MARVEADAEAWMTVESFVDRCELVDRTADRAAGAGGVLHQQPRRVVAELEHLLDRRENTLQSLLEAGTEVRADVDDDGVRADRAGDLHGRAQGRHRLFVDRIVGGGEVAEVERM